MNSMKGQFTRIESSYSQVRRIPRLGKIRLGIKKKSAKGVEYPSETPWFVVTPEIAAVYGDQPTELDVMLPHEDPEVFFPQKLAMYGQTAGLKCHGNGKVARRLNDQNEWVDRQCPCEFLKSSDNPKGACTEQSSLMVFLPKVSLGGCYQITTGSFHSTVTINSALDLIRALAGRVALIPLKLRRVPRTTHNEGKSQTHYTLELILDGDLKMIRDLRADIQGILIPGRLEIEGPVDENKTLDAVDVEEADEDGIDAEKLADMDDKELETVRMALNKQNQVKRTETIKPSPTPSPATKPNGTAVQESFELPAPERIGPGQVPASQWAEVVAYVDANMDLCTLKSDWKAQTKCEQVIRLTPSGQQNFLSFMREQAGAGFPY
jgi:hypothetical protein